MPKYNVHVYREMRVYYPDIEAETPQAAAEIAATRATSEAEAVEDCDGMNLSALVDLVGDEEYERSEWVDFPLITVIGKE